MRDVPRLYDGGLLWADRALRRIPGRTSGLQLRLRKAAFRSYVSAHAGHVGHWEDEDPVPPSGLVAQTSAMNPDDVAEAASRDGYLAGGYLGALLVLRILEREGHVLRDVGSVLDFGCGAGKMLRLFRPLDGLSLTGCDINGSQIEWARAHVPGVEFVVTGAQPPLPFSSGAFDLVWSMSVFTHIPLEMHGSWLEELARVMSPTGWALVTVAGSHHAARQLDSRQRLELAEHGHFTLQPTDRGASYASVLTSQLDVFYTPEAAIDVFSQHFDVVAYVVHPHDQDCLVLRTRERGRAPVG